MNLNNNKTRNVNKNKSDDRNRLPKFIFLDGVKWLMVPSKIILDSLSIWPERQNNTTNFLHIICVTSSIFFLVGQLLFITENINELGALAYAISIVIVSVGTTVRRLLCYFCKNQLAKILNDVYFEFWPSDMLGPKLHNNVYFRSKLLMCYHITTMSFATLWGIQAVTVPIFYGNLPLSTTYPFSWRTGFSYGILYVWQAFMAIELVFTICGLDFFFMSLLLNCITQFKLLRIYLKESFKELEEQNGNLHLSQKVPVQILTFCVERHKYLIRTCKEIENIFSYFILLQYLASIGSVCLSSFVATAVPKEFGTSLTYGLGHMCEIFIYCFMGENLSIESIKLSDSIYKCGWHLSSVTADKNLRRMILMIMVRAQKAVRIAAGGFGYLSLSSFMKLIQFSFSVYTFLKRMMQKHNMHL